MLRPFRLLSVFGLLFTWVVNAQDIKLFRVGDFDLNGPVKLCTVVTNYGKEIFEFDQAGLLIRSTTKYNEVDMDVTRYKYLNGALVEKRMESYKENTLDLSSSLVNFYEIDTTVLLRVKETIVSMDKEFFEQQEYFYDANGELEKIVASHENAVDERVLERNQFKDELTETLFENGVIVQSVRTSAKKMKLGQVQQISLRKQFVDGEPSKAVEEIRNADGLLISEQFFTYDQAQQQFVVNEKKSYSYSKDGVLRKEITKKGQGESVKDFIFQFDDSEHKNWVKKISTPDNSYTTRIIAYHEPVQADENN